MEQGEWESGEEVWVCVYEVRNKFFIPQNPDHFQLTLDQVLAESIVVS